MPLLGDQTDEITGILCLYNRTYELRQAMHVEGLESFGALDSRAGNRASFTQ